MKKLIFLSLFIAFLGLKGYGQFAFGVAPGLSTNTAYFGYNTGNVVPYVGFQFANIGFKLVAETAYWDGSDVVNEETDIKVSGNLYVPDIGVKIFAVQQNNLKAYINLNVAKPLIRAKVQQDGDDVDFYHNGKDGPINDLLKDVKLWGGQLGFGVEYFFDNNFSVGGEFGIMYVRGSFEDMWEEDVWNGTDYQEEDFSQKINISLMPTYSRISLNFYFGGNSGE